MNRAKTKSGKNILAKLIIPAFLALLPMLAVGGAVSGPAQAAAPISTTFSQADHDALAEQYSVLVMRVYFQDVAQRDALAYELSPEEVPTTDGYLTVVRDTALYHNLKARGIRVEVDQRHSHILSDPQLTETFYGGYKTVEEIYAFLDQKVAEHPTLAQKIDIGDTWCKTHPGECTFPQANNGYDLFVMRISNQNIPGPKPVFWADAGVHSREIATPEVVMRYISWLLDNYNTNADARWIVDYHDIYLMPTFNPDGHHIVEAGGGGNSPYYYRKNGNNSLGNCAVPPDSFDHFGVDNNRNFPYKWGCCGGSTTEPCEQTYRGEAPNSEDETIAVTTKIRSLIPDQRGPGDTDPAPITTTGVYQNIHTVVPVNLYPWGWSFDLMPNYNETDNIARRISSPGQGGNDYPYGCITCELYPVDGGSIDWAYGELGVAAISTELGGDSFLPAYNCIDNPGCGSSQGLWPENKGMLTYLSKIARTPYLLSHGPDANSPTTNPMTATVGTSVQLTSTIKFNWISSEGQTNAFSQNVGAAEYYIDTPPWAGGTGVAMTASDGTFNSPQEGVQATIDTTTLPLGRHIVFVRGRGVNDFQGHQTWGPISAVFLDVAAGGTVTPVTATPSATATETIGPFCGAIAVPDATTSCASAPSTYDYTFHFFLEAGGCNEVTGPATLSFYVAEEEAGPFTLFDTQTITVTFPAAVEVYFSGQITVPTVPAPNQYYRIEFDATEIKEGALQNTPVEPLCSTGSVTPSTTTTATTATPSTTTTTTAGTSTAIVTPTACTLEFTDVPEGSTFYENIRCLACRGIINGYTTDCDEGAPCFKPGNPTTRGQMAKIVANSAGFNEPAGAQQYEDVLPGSTFFDYIWRLTERGIVEGYPCGGVGEPCGQTEMPYYRPNTNVTRGQISKIVAEAAGLTEPAEGQQYEDVPVGSTFYEYIWRLTALGIVQGYPCQGVGEPCGDPELPYFRPNNPATRGQSSKIVANTFFPGCQTP